MKKIFPQAAACLLACVALSGCATVFEGTRQDISINSNPPGASCVFNADGQEVGYIASTPGTTSIRKSKYDLIINCRKPGYADATYVNASGTTATIAANIAADILFTGGLSSIVDTADGADNKYERVVNISMMPVGPAVAVSGKPLDEYRTVSTLAAYPVQAPAPSCSREAIETARMARESGYIFKSEC